MTKKTLIALKESIEHWKRLYTGTSATNENTGTNDCPLCKLFFCSSYVDEKLVYHSTCCKKGVSNKN